MAPLILHNVPDDELYVGEDGKQRPYAMLFPQHGGHPPAAAPTSRGRRPATETGSFGRSARRSRSKTATPARREDPTLAAADEVFKAWFSEQKREQNKGAEEGAGDSSSQQKTSDDASSAHGKDSGELEVEEESTADASSPPPPPPQQLDKMPFEVILRGYKSSRHQYAAINHYEQLAGTVCEDYPREPPIENRRYKSELRDLAFTRRRALTPDERLMVNRADGGEHWIKVTFESTTAAEVAMSVSPQIILGHYVFAEPYHGMPPSRDEAIPDTTGRQAGGLIGGAGWADQDSGAAGFRTLQGFPSRGPPRPIGVGGDGAATLPKSFTTSALPGQFSPPFSQTSSRTIESGTLGSLADTATVSSATVTGVPADSTGSRDLASAPAPAPEEGAYMRRAPNIRRVKLMPADQALLPQQSYAQRALNKIPFLKWFSGSMIGNEVPRTELGDFDWDKASLYWKLIWWLDSTFRLFGGEILSADKDD